MIIIIRNDVFIRKGDREVSQFIDGDFLIHFAGKKGQTKLDLMNYYLDLAETSSSMKE